MDSCLRMHWVGDEDHRGDHGCWMRIISISFDGWQAYLTLPVRGSSSKTRYTQRLGVCNIYLSAYN